MGQDCQPGLDSCRPPNLLRGAHPAGPDSGGWHPTNIIENDELSAGYLYTPAEIVRGGQIDAELVLDLLTKYTVLEYSAT
jgi:hypothetical protein